MQNAVNILLMLPVIHRMPQANDLSCCDLKASIRENLNTNQRLYTHAFVFL